MPVIPCATMNDKVVIQIGPAATSYGYVQTGPIKIDRASHGHAGADVDDAPELEYSNRHDRRVRAARARRSR